MKTVVQSLLLVVAVALAHDTHAASRSASIQVSFTIVESCKVQATAQQQSVHCDLATPYAISQPTAVTAPAPQILAGTDSSAAKAANAADPKLVTITF
ncbi:hypothetical protein GTP41_19760 [Pseudoduganella sp. DS3]|uniref:Uncharacterized protein n=1 Tax=Pseudoduganella guangdongensis TaxID=2692179 RepID=A0A6N9HMB7_9BURK|nr:hypothetical protein [Pseudoduganella guangdongensis]MYN04333.1 hypothetical protein [Pseudoduganella guangdongensis]